MAQLHVLSLPSLSVEEDATDQLHPFSNPYTCLEKDSEKRHPNHSTALAISWYHPLLPKYSHHFSYQRAANDAHGFSLADVVLMHQVSKQVQHCWWHNCMSCHCHRRLLRRIQLINSIHLAILTYVGRRIQRKGIWIIQQPWPFNWYHPLLPKYSHHFSYQRAANDAHGFSLADIVLMHPVSKHVQHCWWHNYTSCCCHLCLLRRIQPINSIHLAIFTHVGRRILRRGVWIIQQK